MVSVVIAREAEHEALYLVGNLMPAVR